SSTRAARPTRSTGSPTSRSPRAFSAGARAPRCATASRRRWSGNVPETDRVEAAAPSVSVVVPVYRNTETLEELHRRLDAALGAAGVDFELVFVEDACPAGSLAVLRRLEAADPRVGVLALPRNVGQHAAVLRGLARARGRAVVVMDADLQDPPDAVPALLARRAQGPAAVFAGRRG